MRKNRMAKQNSKTAATEAAALTDVRVLAILDDNVNGFVTLCDLKGVLNSVHVLLALFGRGAIDDRNIRIFLGG